MKFQIGDRVLVLHSNEEGEIVDIINNKMVMVDVRGVKFPAYIDQLDFPYFKRFTEKKMGLPKKEKKYIDDVRKEKPTKEARVEDGVWLTFLPKTDIDEFGDEYVQLLKIHLHNRTNTPYNFIYHLNFFGEKDFELKNQVQPFEDFYLHDVAFSDMSDSPSFDFEFSLINPDKKKASHFESSFRLKPKQLFAKLEEIREKNHSTFSYLLFEKYPDRAADDKMDFSSLAAKGIKVYDASRARQHLEPARSVVDLHSEKLTDNTAGLSSFEILDLQLKTFEKYLELAIQHRLPTLTIIHGVGTGKLRDEIHDILRLKKEVKSFVNQYHAAYGYGATEIFLQY